MKKIILLACIIAIFSACVTSTGSQQASITREVIESNGILLIDPKYDGTSISAILLIKGDPSILLDPRLVDYVHIDIRRIENCSGRSLSYRLADSFPKALSEDELLHLESGAIYGKNMRFRLFDDGPDCIRVMLWIWDYLRKPGRPREFDYRVGRFQFIR